MTEEKQLGGQHVTLDDISKLAADVLDRTKDLNCDGMALAAALKAAAAIVDIAVQDELARKLMAATLANILKG